jgi:hypothetical protein
MKFFFKRKDGGKESTVTGYWLIEAKQLFSIVLLRFDQGSRDVYHSHAFAALTWWLRGEATESELGKLGVRKWRPSFWPKYTPTSCTHKVFANKKTWALSIRGPWKNTWREYHPKTGNYIILTHGRKTV